MSWIASHTALIGLGFTLLTAPPTGPESSPSHATDSSGDRATNGVLAGSPDVGEGIRVLAEGTHAPTTGTRTERPVSRLESPFPSRRWGAHGHRLAARAATAHLPDEMPTFFLESAEQLEYLNPEPDRWRDSDAREMNEGFRYDHYLDLELVPEAARHARDRWEFLRALYAASIEQPERIRRPERDVGLLPWRVAELQQRLENGFRRWRAETNPQVRAWLEERIVYDAGVLGHYVTDASQPHHTTVHFNGWNEELEPNPGGFTTDRGFHARFESRFVGAHVTAEQIIAGFRAQPHLVEDPPSAIWEFVKYINGYVHRLYELDRDHGFEPDEPPHPESLAFAVERIQDGGAFLRDLWWSAWVASGTDVQDD